MSKSLTYWQTQFDDDKTTLDDIGAILDGWEADRHRLTHTWGNCRRGCAPSYLDEAGFCSPACHVGSPRGEYATVIPNALTAVAE